MVRIGQFFIDQGKITEKQLEEALSIHKRKKQLLGETLVYEGMLKEIDMLSYLSNRFNLQYITTEKLEKMALQEKLNDIIPERIADEKNIFPLKYSFNESKLTLLTNMPQNFTLFDELKIVLSINNIIPVIALSKAIRALILKQYRGDLEAFNRIFDRALSMNFVTTGNESVYDNKTMKEIITPVGHSLKDKPETTKVTFTEIINQGEIMRNKADTTSTGIDGKIPSELSMFNTEFVEIIRIFTTLLDRARNEKGFQGHSQRVAIIAKRIGRHINLSDVDLNDIIIAAYLHDVGKHTHLNAFDIAKPEKEEKLIRYAGLPAKLFSHLRIAKNVISNLSNMYETHNGKGYPHKLRLDEIPIGAQIVQIAHTYDFMTAVSHIPNQVAYARIKGLKYFSNKILNALRETHDIEDVQGESGPLKKAILISNHRNLLEEIAEFLSRANFQVITATKIEAGAMLLKQHTNTVDLVLCDIEMPDMQITPLKLLAAIKKKEIFKELKFVFFSSGEITQNIKLKSKALKIDAIYQKIQPEQDVPEIIQLTD